MFTWGTLHLLKLHNFWATSCKLFSQNNTGSEFTHLDFAQQQRNTSQHMIVYWTHRQILAENITMLPELRPATIIYSRKQSRTLKVNAVWIIQSDASACFYSAYFGLYKVMLLPASPAHSCPTRHWRYNRFYSGRKLFPTFEDLWTNPHHLGKKKKRKTREENKACCSFRSQCSICFSASKCSISFFPSS